MVAKDNKPTDIESELIQKMTDMCDRFDKKETKSFLSQLLDSAPSVFITICGIAIAFYVYVNVEINKINQQISYDTKQISDMMKIFIDIREDIKGLDRRLYQLEIKIQNLPK